MVLFLLAATLLMVDVVQAVFTPENTDALKAAVGSCSCSNCDGSNPTFSCAAGGCLGENMTGYCPTFAATTEATTGNPYGVMGDWNVSKVTDMFRCTSTSVLRCLFLDGVTDLFFDLFLIHPSAVFVVFWIISCYHPPFRG